MLVIDRKLLGPDGMPGPELLGTLLRRHAQERVRLDEIGEIYARRHRITSRRRLAGLPNNRLAHDLPGYIATMAAGYLVGSPVRYAPPDGQEDAFEAVRRAYGEASVESVDAELAMDAAVYGKAVELCYADALARPRVAQMDPRSSFVVYDDTVEHAPLFGVACRDLMDEQLRRRGERISVYGPHIIRHFERVGSETPREVGRQAHYFGGVPMVEYWNNAREQGDFEPVMGLIDAYDALQSDRVNDKQQFTDAVFVLKGVGALGIDDTEEVADAGDGLDRGRDRRGPQRAPAPDPDAVPARRRGRRAVRDQARRGKRERAASPEPQKRHPQAVHGARPDGRAVRRERERRGHALQAPGAGAADADQGAVVPGGAAGAASAVLRVSFAAGRAGGGRGPRADRIHAGLAGQ